MKDSLGQYWKEQRLFVMMYSLVLLVSFYFLWQHDRLSGHMIINQYWHTFFDHFFMYFTHIGDGLFGIGVLIFVAFFNWRMALVGGVGFGISAGITQFLKKIVYDDVMRPFIVLWDYFHHNPASHLVEQHGAIQYGNSFPSGHATAAFAIFTFLALYSRNKWIGFLCLFIAILASFSRVYLSEHFTEDIVFGSIIGTSTVWLVMIINRTYFAKNHQLKQYEKSI
jgi:membrane-associated phospholipid phosphatase